MYAWGHNRVAQLGIGNSFTVPRNIEGAYFLPNPQLVESLVGMVSGALFFFFFFLLLAELLFFFIGFSDVYILHEDIQNP